MQDSEKQAIEAEAAEMKELGLEPAPAEQESKPDEPVKTEEKPAAEPAKPEKADESKPSDDTQPEEGDESKQVSIRDLKEMKRGFKDTIERLETSNKDLAEKLAKYEANPTKENQEAVDKAKESKASLDERAKILGEKLGFDTDKTKLILEQALELSKDELGKSSLSDEDRKTLEELREKNATLEQEKIFNTDWSEVEKDLKSKYPNASEEQWKAAKEKMLEVAYQDENGERDLDYLAYKFKDDFEKILFSPKAHSFEPSRQPTQVNDGEVEDAATFFARNPSPAEVEVWEKRQDALVDSLPKQKVRIVSNGIERFE